MADDEGLIIGAVDQVLQDYELDYSSDVVVGSTSTDFYVVAPSGATAVLEVRPWRPTPENLERAQNIADIYRRLAGVDNAYIVLPGRFSSDPDSGVLSTRDLVQVVDEEVVQAPKTRRRKQPEVEPRPADHIFAAMPFAPQFDDTFEVAMKPATLNAGYTCTRVDHESFAGDIVIELLRLIETCSGMIADLSGSRPNVLYELGFGAALKKPMIQICSTDLKDLPFDVRNRRTLKYTIGQSSRLRGRLERELIAVLPSRN